MVCRDCGFANGADTAVCEACGANLFRSSQAAARGQYDDHLLADVVDVLAPRTPLLVESDCPVASAVELMRETGSGYVLIADAGHVRGIFTERDLLERVIALGRVPRAVAIEQVMTRDPVVLRHDDSLAVAINKMVMGLFRHLPLVDAAGRVDGVVSSRELLKHLHRLLHQPENDR